MNPEHPLPPRNPDTAPYWAAAREHRLVLPRCRGCGKLHFHPRTPCPQCGCASLDWQEVSGRGRVHSYTVVHRAPSPEFEDRVPYVAAVIALAEGPHFTSVIGGCSPSDVRIGMAVEVAWEDFDPVLTLPYFVPSGAEPAPNP